MKRNSSRMSVYSLIQLLLKNNSLILLENLPSKKNPSNPFSIFSNPQMGGNTIDELLNQRAENEMTDQK